MRKTILIIILFFLTIHLTAVDFSSLEFSNTRVVDILIALSDLSGKTIIADSTVTGYASYYFRESDFETALRVFLNTFDLYSRTEDGIYYISKIRVIFDKERNLVSVDANEVDATDVLKKISEMIGKTILFDALPSDKTTIHLSSVPPAKAVEVIIAKYSNYSLEVDPDYFYIRRLSAGQVARSSKDVQQDYVQRIGINYNIQLERARFRDVLTELFTEANSEFSLLMKSDIILEDILFRNKSFEQILRLILEQASADFTVLDGIYYIYDVQRKDILKKLKTTLRVQLEYLNVKDINSLLPGDLASSSIYKLDENNNAIILLGSIEEIEPVKLFLESIDIPPQGKVYKRFDVQAIDVNELIKILPRRFASLNPTVIPGTNGFTALVNERQEADLREYIFLADEAFVNLPIKLKYIKVDDLLNNLPPSVGKDNIIRTVDPTFFFFRGLKDTSEQFLNELKLIDKPIPQIRYDLLVIQYLDGKNRKYGLTIENSIPEAIAGVQNAFLGSISNLLNLNFDIVTTFGYLFAINLNMEIGESNASVLADTTLNGLSGEKIKFQNTNTYRYRDMEIDPDTGQLKSTGVTRELTSGLLINIDGWVSGDGMITMEVNATVSKQGSEAAASSNNPPTTSEKVINTHIRTPAGRPVVIGGLIQQEIDVQIKKIPLLGDIPWIGKLFQKENSTMTNSEFVIYIIPHVEYPENARRDLNKMFGDYYLEFIKGN